MCVVVCRVIVFECGLIEWRSPVRRPGDAVDARAVVVEARHGRAGHAHVQDDDFARVHGDGGQVVRVLLVPRQPQQRRVGRVLETTLTGYVTP